jgi:hypothetical protein
VLARKLKDALAEERRSDGLTIHVKGIQRCFCEQFMQFREESLDAILMATVVEQEKPVV